MGKEKEHLSVQLDDGTDEPLRAVSFGVAGTKLGQFLTATPDPRACAGIGPIAKR